MERVRHDYLFIHIQYNVMIISHQYLNRKKQVPRKRNDINQAARLLISRINGKQIADISWVSHIIYHLHLYFRLGRRVKSLERIIVEQGYEGSIDKTKYIGSSPDQSNLLYPNYLSIAAEPSKLPTRHFCSVCGSFGRYTCVRCGSRFCSIRCNGNHKETSCMKFSL